ncbi:MAG: GTP-binding protein [Spirochaetaceae bacterium]|jgi:G3E family GTPase|nr:GTP-binding protein [Spirochaetaceae bacterium]
MEKTKLEIVSGFLGAGKTTLINKLLREAWRGETTAVLENEFGEIGVDGDLLQGHDLTVKEITNGCICCTLKGDFVEGIKNLARDFRPKRIVIEPTGIGKLGDILEACRLAEREAPVSVYTAMTVVQAPLVSAFLEVSGEFYREQIKTAPVIVLSAVQKLRADDPPLTGILRKIRELNPGAAVFTESWDTLDSFKLLAVAEEMTGKILGPEDPHEHDHENGDRHGYGHEHKHGDGHEHNHDHSLETGGFDSCSFILKGHWTGEDVDDLATRMKGGNFGEVFRAKGFFPVRGRPHKLDYVYGSASLTPADYAGEGKFVVIGRGLKKEELSRYMERRGP